jgi:hypothetical protein
MSIATGYLTANNAGLVLPSVPNGHVSSFPATLGAWGTFESGALKVQLGFTDNAGVLNWVDVTGVSLTAAGAVTFSARCDQMRLVLSGATSPNIGYWIG